MKIGQQIKEARKKNRMTQQKLADAVGLASKTVVYNFESGLSRPSVKVLLRISEALNNCKFVIQAEKKPEPHPKFLKQWKLKK